MTEQAELRLNSAIKAARASGAIIRNRFGTSFEVDYKQYKDPVTEIDRECEREIRRILGQEHPGVAFWGEEYGSTDRNAPLTWIVDPLDGTKNFVHGYPFVAVAIALVKDGVPIIGVVYDPLRDEIFSAVEGRGAQLNGKAITVSRTALIEEALVVTTLSCDPPEQAPLLIKACSRCQGVRRGGAAALDLCQLAAGRLDTVWEWHLRPWDLAAASLIIREAQGTVTKIDGSTFDIFEGQILASNTHLHGPVVQMLGES